MAIRCGTCAWADHQAFYPDTVSAPDRLAFYAEYFPVVEVDSTYYGIPRPTSAIKWAELTPDGFVFDVKAYRTLTKHDRGRADQESWEHDVEAFRAVIETLRKAEKLGAVLFQFPPWFVCTQENKTYIERIRQLYSEFLLAIEFRHRSWWLPNVAMETESWLRDNEFVNVVCDEPQVGMGTIPLVPSVTNHQLVMFRLHGRNAEMWYEKGLTSSQQRFDYLYGRDELREFLPLVERWSTEASDVHILMNNNQGDYAVTNALDWQAMLGQPVRARPSLGSRQSTLF